ncbi:helix-turn-helix domain-containing protein [Oceanobacter sp. 4_MG-2023]|uniref:helix-turn-helix domain-containing protein n=1 Tax=Oceanobacter sp. 4_MG-2023 TaxID=3062623 RepID=UPI002734C37B|nr:helix-turn-helix transcriptional regulator [Oceanobacter sp. 4_MG-2023]MDP2546207.1 helix-turn-helix transcriptional regulator [Oceanobacter sp. 4_MG-2023]
MPDLLAEVGVRVRAARLMINLSQEQLAREARVSRSTIKRLEGGTDSVSLSNLLAVLKTLDCIDMFVNALPEPEHSRQRASRTMGY